MNQTNTNLPNFRLLQSLATAKLSAIDALLKRLADPKLTPKQIRTLGCTLLRIPSLRPPRQKPSPQAQKSTRPSPSKPTSIPAALAAFITFANHFNHRLAAAKLAVQTLFLKLINDPATPEAELDRLTTAILRCPLPPLATLTSASASTHHNTNETPIQAQPAQHQATIAHSTPQTSTSTPLPPAFTRALDASLNTSPALAPLAALTQHPLRHSA